MIQRVRYRTNIKDKKNLNVQIQRQQGRCQAMGVYVPLICMYAVNYFLIVNDKQIIEHH